MMKYLIGLIVVLALAGGGYYFYMNSSGGTGDQNAGAQDVVQGQDVTVGTGAEATPGTIVSVLYVGKLQDGTVFDSSEAHGNEPLTFQLGAEGLIPGFQIGVNGMKEGGERLLAIPPALAYGDQDVRQNPQDPASKIIIPANSTLIFSVKLVNVEPAPATTTPAEAE